MTNEGGNELISPLTGEGRSEHKRLLVVIAVSSFIAAGAGYGIASLSSPSSPSPSVMRSEIVTAFRELTGQPKSSIVLTPYVQGMDVPMASTLAQGATNYQSDNQYFLSDGAAHVAQIHLLNSTTAAVNFAIKGATTYGSGGKSFPYDERYIGSAVLDHGRWNASWVTVCMLVEQEGTLCPDPSPGINTPLPLPYSLTASAHIAAETPDLVQPQALAIARDGSLLIVDASREQILRLQSDGTLSVFAGNGKTGFTGNGGPAVDAELNLQSDDGIAVAPNGTVYIPDPSNCQLRAVAPNGIIRTVSNNSALCNMSDVAISATGVPYVAARAFIDKIAPDGAVTKVAGTTGSTASRIANLTPQTVAFTPSAIAFDGAGNLDIWSFEPRAIYQLTPQGTISYLGGEYATQIAPSPSGTVFVATHFGTIDRVTTTGIAQYKRLLPSKIAGLDWPAIYQGFQADGIAIGPSGVIYVDNDMGNGYGNGNALVAIEPDGSEHVVPIHTPLLDTLPRAGAHGFSTSIYPTSLQAVGRSLSACPSMKDLQPFDAAAIGAAKNVATGYNSTLSDNLVNSDRSWCREPFNSSKTLTTWASTRSHQFRSHPKTVSLTSYPPHVVSNSLMTQS